MADAKLEQNLERLLDRLEILLPKTEDEVDWSAAAFRWRRKQYLGMSYGVLEPIHRVALVDPDSIKNADQQKAALLRNTEQFVRGLPANNVLLTGARGTGKSSLIRACLKQFADQGLRLIEVDKEDLKDLINIAQCAKAAGHDIALITANGSSALADLSSPHLVIRSTGSVAYNVPDFFIGRTIILLEYILSKLVLYLH